jgi:hypothetical protein
MEMTPIISSPPPFIFAEFFSQEILELNFPV